MNAPIMSSMHIMRYMMWMKTGESNGIAILVMPNVLKREIKPRHVITMPARILTKAIPPCMNVSKRPSMMTMIPPTHSMRRRIIFGICGILHEIICRSLRRGMMPRSPITKPKMRLRILFSPVNT